MLEVSMKNQKRRSKHPSLQQWHSSSRLNSMFHSAASNKPEETEKIALMQRYRQAIKPTVARFDKNTKKTLGRIYLLIEAARREPFAGIGKPEPLLGNLAGYWSRPIDGTHRLVYAVDDADFAVISCRGHHDD